MRLNLATRIMVIVLGGLLVTVVSDGLAFFSTIRIRRLLQDVLTSNLPSVVAGDQLEVSLLEQRGLVSNFILDRGSSAWLAELDHWKVAFARWAAQARHHAFTKEESEILDRLDDVYRRYDEKRNDVIERYRRGELDNARSLLLGEVRSLSQEATSACRRYAEVNERQARSTRDDARLQLQKSSALMGGSVLLIFMLAGLLMALLHWGVWRPIGRILADVRGRGDIPLPLANAGAVSDLGAIGDYLSALMLHSTDTSNLLERSRRQLVAAERLAAVGRLAASLAHEIRNPLTSMKLWLYSIQTHVDADETTNRKFHIVSDEIQRLENIVENFLDFARPKAPRISPQPVTALIKNTLELVRHRIEERAISIDAQIQPHLPPARMDADQMKQVLINLIENSAAAVRPGGRIHILATEETSAEGRVLVIRVRDDGAGIPEEARSRIFEPFFSTKEDGAGLGLCVAAQILALHHGSLELESTTGEGTTFAIRLPFAEDA